MADEGQMQKKREQLIARLQPEVQTPVVAPPKPKEVLPTNLSQMRPVVRDTVGEQEQKATRVVGATFALFEDAIAKSKDLTMKKEFDNSQLKTLLR